MDLIEQDIRGMIATITEHEPDEITADAHIFRDLGADSMSALELMATLEKKYQIVIKPEEVQNLVTLGQAAELIRRYLKEKAA